ncbi:MAG TPA: ABC transporter permease [bacterium]|nr:ABC transporter permease [bacterium]
MSTFLARRMAAVVPTLFGVTVVVFLTLKMVPGDPALALLGPRATEDSVAELRREMGLTRPLAFQYGLWLSRVMHGDLGRSYIIGTPIAKILWPKFLNTLLLASVSLAVALAVGVSIGTLSAARRYSPGERGIMFAAQWLGNAPPYWFGLLLVVFFSLRLRWLPSSGMFSYDAVHPTLDLLAHLALPALATAAAPGAIIARLVRGSMLDVLGHDHVRTARAKGLSEARVLGRHVLQNALPPILTITGLQAGFLLGGAIFTETIFAWPGIGLQLYDSISARDYPVVQAATLLVALMFITVNVLVDLAVVLVDPRVRA